MHTQQFPTDIRPDGWASHKGHRPSLASPSSKGRGWDGIAVERVRFSPFNSGEVIYDEHFIGLVLEEQARFAYAVDGRSYEGIYNRGDLVLSPSGQRACWTVFDGWDGLVLTLRPELLRHVAGEMGLNPAGVRLVGEPRTRDPLILQIGEALLAVLREASPGERAYVESLRDALAIHLLRNYSSLSPREERQPGHGLPSPKLRRAIEAIQENLESGISLRRLAEAAGVSVSHFEVLFKRSTGLSPYQFVLRCRIERAKRLLQDEGLSLAQVAARAGFCDQGHLARQFKRIVGVTPSGFRRRS